MEENKHDILGANTPEHENSRLPEEPSFDETDDAVEETGVVSEAEHEDSMMEEEHEQFEQAALPDLLHSIHQAIGEDRIKEFRKSFTNLKKRLKELVNEERQQLLAQFIEQGGKAEDFKHPRNEVEVKLREAIKKYTERLNDLRKREEQELSNNLLIKQDIVQEMRKILDDETDVKRAFNRFKELKDKWNATGHVPANLAEDLRKSYHHFSDKFYEQVKLHHELFEMEIKKNQQIKEQIIARAEALLENPSIKKSIETAHALQKEWRDSGPVMKEISEEIFMRFKGAIDKVYMRRDEFVKEQEQARIKNLEIKSDLCEKAEAIANGTYATLAEWKKVEPDFTAIEEVWRKTGRVPAHANDQIWERFRAARKEYFRKRNLIQKKIAEELAQNYTKKLALCEQAEALSASTDWKNTSQQLIRLQNDWKKIGPVERKKSDEIWQRFRKACDAFFNARESFNAGAGDREKENLVQKLALIEEIKAFEPLATLEESMAALRTFQKQWNSIGFVPIKEKAGLEKAFEESTNQLLAKLNLDKDKQHKMEYKMKLEHMLQSNNAMQQLRDERTWVGNKMRKLEEEIIQIENNLGFFGQSKGADSLKKQYEQKIELLRQELATLNDRKMMLKTAFKTLESSASN